MTTALLRDPIYHAGDLESVGPGRTHFRRAGAPMGRTAAHQSNKQAREILYAIDSWCFMVCQILENQLHGVQSTELPRFRSKSTWV